MIKIAITPDLKTICPELHLNCLECNVNIEPSNQELREMIDAKIRKISSSLEIENINRLPAIAASRKAFKKLGKDPSRYRFSAEALLRRIVSKKGLNPVNNVIDILNMISFESGYSIGGYDLMKLSGDVICGTGRESEMYHAIGRGIMNIACIIVLRDDIGPFGTPVSDSERTMVGKNTKRFLMVFFNFLSQDEINPWISNAENMLKDFAMATCFNHKLIN
jgi:DNA/RNA-binding domain of Phe-tRNA-synthetase-like protein